VHSLNVWRTVSSLANKDPSNKSNVQFRQIELNWINAPLNDDGDYIALYLDSEPEGSVPVSVHHPRTTSGKLLVEDHYLPVIDFYNETFRGYDSWDDHADLLSLPPDAAPGQSPPATKQRLIFNGSPWNQRRSTFAMSDLGSASRHDWSPTSDRAPDPQPGLVDECIGYCVAYHSQRRMLAKSCLRTYPNWMHDSQIGSRSLTTIAVAGTHNSGTYLKQRPGLHKLGEQTSGEF
jgi:hypothetical protein